MLRIIPFLFLFFSTAATASDLTVRVVDPQGGGVPGARLELHRRDAGFATEAFTSERGAYRFLSLAPGRYLLSARAPGFATAVLDVLVDGPEPEEIEVTLEIAAVEESIVVTSAKTAQRRSEITKSVSVVDASEMAARDEYFVPEAIRTVPGVRMEQLGGPGAFTSLKIRGLRTEDTAVLVDGARLRDPSAPQGDASSFLESLVAAGMDRVEILRGSGSSLHGTNAGGGVIQIVTAPGGGEPRGSLLFEGGGLGLLRGAASGSGGIRDRFLYSAGASYVSVSEGVDGDDRWKSAGFQGKALLQLTPSSTVSVRLFGSDASLGLNESPVTLGRPLPGEVEAVPLADSELKRYETGTPPGELQAGSATYIPSANDPDTRREGSFTSTLVTFDRKPAAGFSYALRYHGLFNARTFEEGPEGPSPFEPSQTALDLFDGTIHTLGARADYEWGGRQVLHAGYELERESFESRSVPAPGSAGSLTSVSQSSHTFYLQDQITLLEGRLSVSASARAQLFSLHEPRFEPREGAPYQGVEFSSPDDAATGDLSGAYAFATSGTRLRAHFGTGYRAPSLFERFGASFSSFGYSVYGDPMLPPERTLAFDAGIEQSLLSDRVRLEATYFRTRLSEILVFDFSGAIDPATDPYGRFGGYLSTDGGVTRGVELAARLAPVRGVDLKASYTHTDAEPPRGVSPEQSQAFAIPRHQFSLVASRSFGPRFSLGFDLLASSSYLAPVLDLATFASRVYRFEGYVKADLVARFRVPAGSAGLSLFGKIENLFDQTLHASGFRTPGRYALAGIGFEF